MKKLGKKQEILIAAGLGIVFLLMVGRLVISGLYTDLSELQQQIKVSEKRLNKGLRVQRDKDTILSAYKKSEPYLKKIGENERRIFAEFLKEVESLVRSVDGNIINLTPQDAPDVGEAFKEYKINFRIETSFSELLQFLSTVEESERLMKLERLTVTSPGDGAYVLMVEGTISLAVPI